jgi:phosphoglycerate dehydrogenase-like enzyme
MFKVALIANDDHPLPDWVKPRLEEAGVEYVYHQCYNRDDLERYAADADVLWLMSSRKGLIVEENMDVFKKAGAVVKCGSGTDNIDHEACTRRGIIVAHTPEEATEPTSDHSIALLFCAVRQVAVQDRLVRSCHWDPRDALPLGSLSGADLGLIGFGRIGQAIVSKLSGFRMNIRVFDPNVDSNTIEQAGCRKVDLETLLRESQYVIVACPLTQHTTGLLGENELRMMRPDSVLVNCARAGIVDEPSLIRALKEGRIKGAALDVLGEHPLEPGDEMLSLDNLTLTPHMGGYPSNYPSGLFESVVNEIVEMSNMHMPRWIVNKGVVPKWKMRQ